ncbi:MAG: hypothetical protein ACI8WT_001375 [Clostridium sp.]
MLYFFTDPYEDEILYSVFARYNKYSGNISSRKTEEELFGRRTSNQTSNFPCYLEYFSKQLINKSVYSPEFFINNNTIFPVYRPFLSLKRASQLLEDMKGDKAVSIHMRIGEMAGGICKEFGIRVCLSCINEDEEMYGEAYIHRMHQVPGNQICNKHSESLRKVILPKRLGITQLIELDQCTIELENQIVNDYNLKYFINLSKDISELFGNMSEVMNLENTIKKYKVMFMRKGFSSISGTCNWIRIEKEFLDFYPSDFLSKLESNIMEGDYKWINQLLSEKKLVHPIRHLLFIRFIFGSLNNFMMFNELEYRPFGVGPWPCLNPAASHYKKQVVTDLGLSKRSKAQEPLGIFKCNCGYTYTRLGPDKDIDDRYKKRFVKSYGDIWMSTLKDNIQKKYNLTELEKLMECDSKTIGKYAKSLGVFHLLNSKMKTEPIGINSMSRYDKNLEIPYKSDIISFIKNNPNSMRADITQKFSKQCAWLIRYRKDWYNLIMPIPLDRKLDNRKIKSYVNWEDRDNELSIRVQKVIKEIKLKEFTFKITITFLCRELKFPIDKHFNELPKTVYVLKNNMVIMEL